VVAAQQDVRPEAFGRYVLLDRIGEGGMAEVFRAIIPGAEGFKRTLVIKRILSQLSQSERFVDMFVREARIGSLLNHPNIVQVYDFGNVDGHYFLAMEYVRGRDVLAIVRQLRSMKRTFPVPVAAFIAHEVATCLGYAHGLSGSDGRSLDIVHRDVSPSNVMCLREGGVKLLDFGIASALSEANVEHTDQGTFKGKLAYMAPERLRNETLDARADLYSLGVMLWEMLTCRRLFRGASEAETFKNVLEMAVPAPSTVRPDVPPALDAIVLKSVARDRDQRYASGHVMADELEEVMRETNFKARMVPRLLGELFGSGAHSSQVALSCLTPELLAAAGAASQTGAGTGSGIGSLSPSERRPWRSWRRLAVVAAGALAAAGFVVLGMRSSPPVSPPAAAVPPAPTQPSTPLPVAVPAPPVVVPVETAGPTPSTAELAVSPPTERPKRAAAGKRVGRAAAQTTGSPIASGLSIDPFAEASRRKPR
jgi:eukaryotic-like serine/threonine-protein kinase